MHRNLFGDLLKFSIKSFFLAWCTFTMCMVLYNTGCNFLNSTQILNCYRYNPQINKTTLTARHIILWNSNKVLSEDDSTPVHVAMRWPSAACVHIPRSRCTSHKLMWNFTILKFFFFFSPRKWEAIPNSSWQRGTYMPAKLSPIKPKANSPLKIAKLFHFPNFISLSQCFQWLLLFTAAMVGIEIPVVYAMHDGQNLKHPLEFPIPVFEYLWYNKTMMIRT